MYLSSSFMSVHWSFKSSAAKAMLGEVASSELEGLFSSLSEQWERLIAPHRLLRTKERSVASKAARVELELSVTQVQTLITVLRACDAEFGTTSGGWVDFWVAAPGGVADYGLEPAEFLQMAGELEATR
jgi:hypothetical protein